MKSEKSEKLNIRLEKGISILRENTGVKACLEKECGCRTLEYDSKMTRMIFVSILFTTHVAALICLVIIFNGGKVHDDRLIELHADLHAVQDQCDTTLRLMRYKLRYLENLINKKLNLDWEENGENLSDSGVFGQYDLSTEEDEFSTHNSSDFINKINKTDDNEHFRINISESFINITNDLETGLIDYDDSELQFRQQLCAKLLTSELQDNQEYSRLCKDLEIHSSRTKRSNMRGKQSGRKSTTRRRVHPHKKPNIRGPVASHFKGGVPETYIRDGGSLVAPWYPDEKASAAFTLKYEFREGKGTVEVSEEGLYLIYAQVYYLTSEPLNTYVINVKENDGSVKPLAYCSSNAVIPEGGVSEVSCYTSVIRYLNATNQVYVTQRDRNRRMILRDGHSFLGLICLNSAAESKRRRNNRERN